MILANNSTVTLSDPKTATSDLKNKTKKKNIVINILRLQTAGSEPEGEVMVVTSIFYTLAAINSIGSKKTSLAFW